MIEQQDHLLPGEESFAGEQVAAAFTETGISVLTGAEIVRFASSGLSSVTAQTSAGTLIDSDVVVSAVGRRPATDELGVDRIGLEPGAAIEVDESLRSVVHPDWLLAVGDVTGSDLFTHMGKYEARMAADTILHGTGDVGPGRTAVPRVVFVDPVVAAVGHTEASAKTAGYQVETRQADIGQLAEASIWGEDVSGTAKLVLNGEDESILGATFTGPSPVAEMVFGAQLAIVTGTPIGALRHVVPQFPTFSEIWLQLVEA